VSDYAIEGPMYLVTARNHEKIAELTGYTQREIAAFYQKAQDAGDVCFVEPKN
jgi:tRNA isopentenyl-2-thiomethyl-A-37 hydroxylase MiaE